MPCHHLRDMPAIRWKTENLRKFAHAINACDKQRLADQEALLREAFTALDRGDDRGQPI
ncbi:hypothetical protein [Paraburkholderia silvatlantica]|uniref:Uncharacterized protein n=1 Tax=Paraburkholderia silvatlantica TaxID=321895 RepID=A0ABR6FGZ4_9BURK|nr:hypothetical protein [Paraburkholderia silvatlantica]MBB2926682.1 hypothetical protein [Paraburkholderia silvatlantica]